MKAYDLVELAGRNLREAVLRNSLTTLGISVGVASLVALLSLGAGLQKLAARQLGRSGLFDSIVVTSRQDFRGDRPSRGERGNPIDFKPLDDSARKGFERISKVVEVYPDVRGVAEFDFAGPGETKKTHFAMLAGLSASARANDAFDDLHGNFFSAPNAPEAVILSNFGRELLGLSLEPGQFSQKLTGGQVNQLLGKDLVLRYAERQAGGNPSPASPKAVSQASPGPGADQAAQDMSGFSVVRKEHKLTIVGIIDAEPYGGMRANRARIFLPIEFAESLNMIQPGDLRSMLRPAQGKSYLAMFVRVAQSKDVADVEDAIKKEGFSTFSVLDASQGITRFFTFLDLFLGIFGSLALAVASLGIVNTLVMAILERRREIGIMKAIGASDGDVKKIFFVEAGAMGLLGGVAGVALGWMIGRVINFGTNLYLQRQEIKPENFWYVPWWLVAAALGFSVVVSLLSGLYPAARAAKLDPVKALREAG